VPSENDSPRVFCRDDKESLAQELLLAEIASLAEVWFVARIRFVAEVLRHKKVILGSRMLSTSFPGARFSPFCLRETASAGEVQWRGL
jgi:hypothetical protein